MQNSAPEPAATRCESGTLYIVATPLGNLGDMSTRGVDILRRVSLVAAEDTRHSRPLLDHFGIATRLVSYHDHSGVKSAARILKHLQRGESVALISDAGTPLISDPGFKLVRNARRAGYQVIPVPGPSALVAALSVAGLPSNRFAFEGFLASGSTARKRQLASLAQEPRTLVFYESSHRIGACVDAMIDVLGSDREIFVGRELTKKFETHFLGGLGACRHWLEADARQQKGEFVLVLAGAELPAEGEAGLRDALAIVAVLREELSLKKAVRLASRLSGVRKNALYKAAIAASGQGNDGRGE